MLHARDVHVVVRGTVGDREQHHARERLAHVARHLRDPVLFARVTLAAGATPDRPALARAVLDVNGRTLLATTSAESMAEAIDGVHERLRHQLERLAGRRKARRRRVSQMAYEHA